MPHCGDKIFFDESLARDFIEKAIIGREFAKLKFTQNLSDALQERVAHVIVELARLLANRAVTDLAVPVAHHAVEQLGERNGAACAAFPVKRMAQGRVEVQGARHVLARASEQ